MTAEPVHFHAHVWDADFLTRLDLDARPAGLHLTICDDADATAILLTPETAKQLRRALARYQAVLAKATPDPERTDNV